MLRTLRPRHLRSLIFFVTGLTQATAPVLQEAYPLVVGLGVSAVETLANNARIHDHSHLALRLQV